MKLSVVIPAQNEESSIAQTVRALASRLNAEGIEKEIIVVDDGSSDRTGAIGSQLQAEDPDVRCVRNDGPSGFGFAVRRGLDLFSGDAVAIVMADLSDSPDDLVSYYRVLEEGYDCAFGSRFIAGSSVNDYPTLKLTLNRVVNVFSACSLVTAITTRRTPSKPTGAK